MTEPDWKRPKPIRVGKTSWKRLRDRACDAGMCVGCGRPGRATPAFDGDPSALDAHHVFPKDLGGDDLLVNLAPLHHRCHMAYEDREEPQWRSVADGIRAHWIGTPFLAYLALKVDGPDAWLDRHYPTDERSTSAA